MYSPYVSFVLGSMVITGAARSIVAKLFYQFGFEHPLFLTLLYLGGQALSLIPYNIWRCCNKGEPCSSTEDEDLEASVFSHSGRSAKSLNRSQRLSMGARASSARIAKSAFTNGRDREAPPASERGKTADSALNHDIAPNAEAEGKQEPHLDIKQCSQQENSNFSLNASNCKLQDVDVEQAPSSDDVNLEQARRSTTSTDEAHLFDRNAAEIQSKNITATPKTIKQQCTQSSSSSSPQKSKRSNRPRKTHRSVSVHGLPHESKTEQFVSRIPWYIKPAVPAFFNLLNSAMRWASLVFVAASVAEMLISGMELVLSVLATRCVRGRHVTFVRWGGVAVTTAGIIMVGIFDTMNAASTQDDNSSSQQAHNSVRDQTIGILLILGQSMMSVIQDLTEELFMHEADFPPALLVGMEGLLGLVIALILYFPIAPLLGEQPTTVLEDLDSSKIIGLSVGWALLVTVTGIFNIAATGVTSSMTRNVWKNFRTCLIWIVGLIIFYATGNPSLGEPWTVPGSFYILLGFSVMLIGIYIYYGKGARAG